MSSDSTLSLTSASPWAARCRIWLIRALGLAMIVASILKTVWPERAQILLPAERVWILAASVPEFACGSWLLFYAVSAEAVIVSVLVAFTFASIDAYKAFVVTTESCGCFGDIQVRPITAMVGTLGLGFALCFAAYFSRSMLRWPPLRQLVRDSRYLGWILVTLAIVAGTATAGIGLNLLHPSHVRISTDYLKNIPPDEHVDVTLVAQNLSSDEIRIIGGQSDCVCLTTGELPITIPPGGSSRFRVHFRPPHEAKRFEHRIQFFTTDPLDQVVSATISGDSFSR